MMDTILNSLMLADGVWHLTSPADQGVLEWPDWVIARKFGANGMPVWFHRLLGIFLITASLIYNIHQKNFFSQAFLYIVIPVTTLAILGAITVSQKGDPIMMTKAIVSGLFWQVLPMFMVLLILKRIDILRYI